MTSSLRRRRAERRAAAAAAAAERRDEDDGDGGDDEARRLRVVARPRRPRASGDVRDDDRGGRGRGREERDDRDDEPDVEDEPRTGVLDILPNGSGFMRVELFRHSSEDVYVSPAQIRRCELRAGDELNGPVRPPRRSERHPSLVRVDKVNDGEPEPPAERPALRGPDAGLRPAEARPASATCPTAAARASRSAGRPAPASRRCCAASSTR